MFKIGEFSRIARVSCRLLRYYDELGLLKPAIVDSTSGYRFYSASQLPQLNRILVLKELGLSLEQIARIVADNISTAELRAMLLLRRSDIEQTLITESERLRQIESRIAQIDLEDRVSLDDVLIRNEPEKKVLSLRTTVHSFAQARNIIRQLVDLVPRQIPKTFLGSVIAIAHTPEFEPHLIDVELGYILDDQFNAPAITVAGINLQVRELPNVRYMAVCVRSGLPEHAHTVTTKIGLYAETNGYALAGPNREVFLQTPRPDYMEKSIVEMQFPLEPRSVRSG